MIEESKYYSKILAKNSTKCLICDNDYVDNDVKVRHNFHITEKCRGSVHRVSIINVALNHKFPVLIHNLMNYDSHLIINQAYSILQKYISFTINNRLSSFKSSNL